MKIKRIDSKVFNFVRKINMFKARKRSKQGKKIKKYRFLLKVNKKLTNRFSILAKYRRNVKLFYLKKIKYSIKIVMKIEKNCIKMFFIFY